MTKLSPISYHITYFVFKEVTFVTNVPWVSVIGDSTRQSLLSLVDQSFVGDIM